MDLEDAPTSPGLSSFSSWCSECGQRGTHSSITCPSRARGRGGLDFGSGTGPPPAAGGLLPGSLGGDPFSVGPGRSAIRGLSQWSSAARGEDYERTPRERVTAALNKGDPSMIEDLIKEGRTTWQQGPNENSLLHALIEAFRDSTIVRHNCDAECVVAETGSCECLGCRSAVLASGIGAQGGAMLNLAVQGGAGTVTPLHIAVDSRPRKGCKCYLVLLRMMLEQPQLNVNIGLVDFPKECPPLVTAARRGNTAAVQELIHHPEIKPNLMFGGMGALDHALLAGNTPMVKALVEHPELDPNRKDRLRNRSAQIPGKAGKPGTQKPVPLASMVQQRMDEVVHMLLYHPLLDTRSVQKVLQSPSIAHNPAAVCLLTQKVGWTTETHQLCSPSLRKRVRTFLLIVSRAWTVEGDPELEAAAIPFDIAQIILQFLHLQECVY